MTDQDRKLYRGQLLVQLEDAEGDLSLLQANAISVAKMLEAVAVKLRRNAELQPAAADFTLEADVENRLTPDERIDFPSVAVISKQIEELKQSRQDVFNFRKARRPTA